MSEPNAKQCEARVTPHGLSKGRALPYCPTLQSLGINSALEPQCLKERRIRSLEKQAKLQVERTLYKLNNKIYEPKFCEPCSRYVNNVSQHKTTKMHKFNSEAKPCSYCSTHLFTVKATVKHLKSDYHKQKAPKDEKLPPRLVG